MTGSLHERIEAVRDALAAAKDTDPPAREEHIKTALGEVLYLAAHEGVRTADLHELLTSAVVAPDEEVPYFLNRASDMLEKLEEDIQEKSESLPEPPASDVRERPAGKGALTQIATARDTLDAISHADVEDDVSSHLINALEELDNILLDADGSELLDARARAHEATDAQDGGPVTDPRETPDDVIKQRHAEAGLCDTVPITIELTPAMIELIDFVRDADDGESFTDWIKNAIQLPLARRDHEFWNSITVPVEAELPPEAARWARLWANHYAATGSDHHDIETHMMDYIDLDFEWRAEGGEELDLAENHPGEKGDECNGGQADG